MTHSLPASNPATGTQAVHDGARPLDLVPFWKPPNIRDRMISTTISSSTTTRHPPARDCGQVYQIAQQKTQTAARQSPLLTEAQKNTEEMLTGMLTSLGFQHVTVTFGGS